MVGVGQSRVQLQGAEVRGLGPLPIAVVGLQGEGQGQVGVRPALVDGQGLAGGFLGLGEDDVGHFPAVIAAEVVGIGQGGLGGDVGVVGPHGAAETVDRQAPLLLLPLRQQGQSLEVEPVGLDRLGGGVGPRPPVGGQAAGQNQRAGRRAGQRPGATRDGGPAAPRRRPGRWQTAPAPRPPPAASGSDRPATWPTCGRSPATIPRARRRGDSPPPAAAAGRAPATSPATSPPERAAARSRGRKACSPGRRRWRGHRPSVDRPPVPAP